MAQLKTATTSRRPQCGSPLCQDSSGRVAAHAVFRFPARGRRIAIVFTVFAVCFLFDSIAVAKRYLTLSQAKAISFPQATRFEEETIRFSQSQIDEIKTRIGAAPKNLGNKVWLAYNGNDFQGVLFLDYVLGKHEIIDYTVALAPDGSVLQVELLEFRESHGYEISRSKWRSQFRGKTTKDQLKLNDDIDNISGATISCRNVTAGIKRVLATFEIVVRPWLATAGKLPDSARR